MGRFLKRMFKLGLLAGVAYAAWRWFEAQRAESDLRWEPQRPPYPPEPRAQNPSPPLSPPASPVTASAPAVEAEPAAAARGDAWVEPVDGVCPASHPVKAKMSSGIFHVAGGLNYERTKPDRCYRDPAAAEADGLRRAVR